MLGQGHGLSVGGEVFAGYDWHIARRIVVGGEAAVQFGGRTAAARNSDYAIGLDPRWGFSATGRLGYVVAPKVMIYGGAGYGGHNYRGFQSGAVAPGVFGSIERTRSFVLRGGVELAASRRVRARLEFQHLDGTRNQFMLGVPIRF